MNFLQPALLAALPLAALPLLIHLIYQRRYQTVRWGAMMFLLNAQGTPRGYARLRRWLILLFRTLVILALIVALSRPLASGSIGAALGGGADTVIVLLDRSPSMQQRDPTSLVSKLETGRNQLVQTLHTLPAVRWVLIDSAAPHAQEIASLDILADVAEGTVDATADIPSMLQAAYDYVAENRPGSVDVWVVTDLRSSDWQPGSGRWPALRTAFAGLAQDVGFHLLTYPQSAPDNLAVRVTAVRRPPQDAADSLLLSLQVQRSQSAATEPAEVPIRIEVQGARWEETASMEGSLLQWSDHPIPLDRGAGQGWGRISIAADTNLADNEWYFAFGPPPVRHTVVVAEDPQVAESLQLAASIAPDRHTQCTAEIVDPAALATVDWQRVALLLWQGNLPQPSAAPQIERFVADGGQVIFFPPRAIEGKQLLGVGWTPWNPAPQPVAVTDWRGDHDLLAHTQSGSPLPVGRLQVSRHAGLTGPITPLAMLENGQPLLARVLAPESGVYFCTTTPLAGDSSLAADGVVLYVIVQRASQQGAAALSSAQQRDAGDASTAHSGQWKRIAGADDAHVLSSQYGLHRGVYADQAGQQLAVNRAAAEDATATLDDGRLAELLGELRWTRVDDAAGSASPLVQEVWRLFLLAASAAMLLEAGLSLPRRAAAARSRG